MNLVDPAQGEIWYASFPTSSLSEQTGDRPVIIVQDDKYGRDTPVILVVPLSSRQMAQRFDATCVFEPNQSNGLSSTSVALVFQLRALDRSRLRRRVGYLTEGDFELVMKELDKLVGRARSTEEKESKPNLG